MGAKINFYDMLVEKPSSEEAIRVDNKHIRSQLSDCIQQLTKGRVYYVLHSDILKELKQSLPEVKETDKGWYWEVSL